MLMPDYHTLHTQAQDRITRCQREAAHAQGDMRYIRQCIATLLHQLARALEPASALEPTRALEPTHQPHYPLHSHINPQLHPEVYAHE